MKFLLYNIYKGCKGKERFNNLIKFIKEEDPDIFGLLEMDGWRDKDFKRVMEFKNELFNIYPYAIFLESNYTNHDIGLFSKKPIGMVEKLDFRNNGLICSFVHNSKSIDVALIHLHPHSDVKREEEMDELFRQIRIGGCTIIMGDFNESPKFSYFNKTGDKLLYSFYSSTNTVPTLYNTDELHKKDAIKDYFLYTSDLDGRTVEGKVIKNKITDHLSDHYPVTLTIDI